MNMITTLKVSEIFKIAWAETKKHFWFLILSTAIYFVLTILLNQFGEGPAGFFLGLAGFVVGLIFKVGLTRISLLIESGRTPKSDDFKTEPIVVFKVFVANIICILLTVLGLMLLIVPGIIVLLRLSMTTYIIVDKNLGAWESVKKSWKLTKGHSWKLLSLGLISILLAIAGLLPVGLGLLIVLPLLYIVGAIFYRKISKEDHSEVSVWVTPPPTVSGAK